MDVDLFEFNFMEFNFVSVRLILFNKSEKVYIIRKSFLRDHLRIDI